MHSGDKASAIVYFTLLVGEHCSDMMINRTQSIPRSHIDLIRAFEIFNIRLPTVFIVL